MDEIVTSMLAPYLKQSTIRILQVYKRTTIEQCVFCLSPSPENICTACMVQLPQLGQHCPQCAEPNTHGHTCGQCLKQPPAFDQVVSPFILKGPISSLIQGLKRSPNSLGFKQLSGQLSNKLTDYQFDGVIALPYHWRKLMWRGHSPTQLLAQAISRQTGTPIMTGLMRIKATPSQQGLDRSLRRGNVRNAFAFRESKAHTLKNKNILIIDDVLTTGASCHAAATVLKRHGAKSVTVACLARTPLDI